MFYLPTDTKTGVLLKEADLQEKENTGSISIQKRDFPNADDAGRAFLKIKRKLFNINEWNANSSKLISFALFDQDGKCADDKEIREDVFLRIYMKGSGSYDWVKFTEIFQSADEVILKVSPTFDPTNDSEDQKSTAHFLTAESSNNFCLVKAGSVLHLCVIGLNERQNTSETDSLLAAVRNFATANVGYYLEIQKSQWTTFCRNFLDSVDGE